MYKIIIFGMIFTLGKTNPVKAVTSEVYKMLKWYSDFWSDLVLSHYCFLLLFIFMVQYSSWMTILSPWSSWMTIWRHAWKFSRHLKTFSSLFMHFFLSFLCLFVFFFFFTMWCKQKLQIRQIKKHKFWVQWNSNEQLFFFLCLKVWTSEAII